MGLLVWLRPLIFICTSRPAVAAFIPLGEYPLHLTPSSFLTVSFSVRVSSGYPSFSAFIRLPAHSSLFPFPVPRDLVGVGLAARVLWVLAVFTGLVWCFLAISSCSVSWFLVWIVLADHYIVYSLTLTFTPPLIFLACIYPSSRSSDLVVTHTVIIILNCFRRIMLNIFLLIIYHLCYRLDYVLSALSLLSSVPVSLNFEFIQKIILNIS